jgi:hypothetical protein
MKMAMIRPSTRTIGMCNVMAQLELPHRKVTRREPVMKIIESSAICLGNKKW